MWHKTMLLRTNDERFDVYSHLLYLSLTHTRAVCSLTYNFASKIHTFCWEPEKLFRVLLERIKTLFLLFKLNGSTQSESVYIHMDIRGILESK